MLAAVGAAMDESLQRIEAAILRLGRITSSPKADAIRCARAGVAPLPPVAQRVLHEASQRGVARISDIARSTQTGDAAVSRQLKLLEEQGLVRREPDPRDGRAALVRLTPAGRRVRERLRRTQDEIFQELLAGWSPRKLELLADLMEQLASDLHEPQEEPRQSRQAQG